VAVKQALGVGDSFAVVATSEALEADEMAVITDDISGTLPWATFPIRRSAKTLQSPVNAEGPTVISIVYEIGHIAVCTAADTED
jgi:hypothetical protein